MIGDDDGVGVGGVVEKIGARDGRGRGGPVQFIAAGGFTRGAEREYGNDIGWRRGGKCGHVHQAARVAAERFGETHHPVDGQAARAAFELVDLRPRRVGGIGQLLQGPAALPPPEFDAIRRGHAVF